MHLGGIRRMIFVRNMFMLHYTTTRARNMVAACQARPDPPTAEPHQMTAESVAVRSACMKLPTMRQAARPYSAQHQGSACIAPSCLARAH